MYRDLNKSQKRLSQLLDQQEDTRREITRLSKLAILEANLPHMDLLNQIAKFMDAISLVFHEDWSYTSDILKDYQDDYIKGSFLEPENNDLGNNWANQKVFIEEYQATVKMLQEHHIDVLGNIPQSWDPKWRKKENPEPLLKSDTPW